MISKSSRGEQPSHLRLAKRLPRPAPSGVVEVPGSEEATEVADTGEGEAKCRGAILTSSDASLVTLMINKSKGNFYYLQIAHPPHSQRRHP